MSEREEMRRDARQDLVRTMAEHERKKGNALPNMREIERKAHEVGERNDQRMDWGKR